MKILFLTNSEVSKRLIDWLINHAGEEVMVYRDQLITEIAKEISPDFLISYNYRYIIKSNILEMFQNLLINLHISFLPWNRGADPNVWSFLENTPKGVTIHCIDSGIDTGAVLCQKEVYIDEEKETLRSAYAVLHEEIQKLFIVNWDAIRNQDIMPKEQQRGGSFHSQGDFNKIRHILGEKGWDIPIPELKKRYARIKSEL